jgi:hypothetical protein
MGKGRVIFMKKLKNMAMVLLALLLIAANLNIAEAAKISSKSYAMMVGETITLSVLDTKKTVKWSTGNKAVASVDKKGNVKAKKTGETVITAKVGKSTYTCKVKVTKAVKAILYNQGSVTEEPGTDNPSDTPSDGMATIKPGMTLEAVNTLLGSTGVLQSEEGNKKTYAFKDSAGNDLGIVTFVDGVVPE